MFLSAPIRTFHSPEHASKIHQPHAIETFFSTLSTHGQDSVSSFPNKLGAQDRQVDSVPYKKSIDKVRFQWVIYIINAPNALSRFSEKYLFVSLLSSTKFVLYAY